MASGTDLFNSTKGQFSDYTTLIGGEAPDTSYWFYEDFDTSDNVTTLVESFEVVNGTIQPRGNANSDHSFSLDQKNNLKNCVVIVDYVTGDIATDSSIGVFVRKTGSDKIYCLVNETDSKLQIMKYVSSTATELSSTTIPALIPNKRYWIVLIAVGDVIRAQLWSSDPRINTVYTAQVTTELTGSVATTFDVESEIGITDWVPKSSNAAIDSIEVGRAFADNTDVIGTVVDQKHVDIRDFINYRYPTSFRTLKELKAFHISEKAFSQTITLDQTLTSGNFNILFYPSDNDPYVPITIGPLSYNASSEDIKTALNQAISPVINNRYNYSLSSALPVKNVQNNLTDANKNTLVVEFDESFGEISLLQIDLTLVTPSGTVSIEMWDAGSNTGTFAPTNFDINPYIESGDPLDKTLTLDDLRIEYAFKNENWRLFNGTNPANAPSQSHFRGNDLFVGKLADEGNLRGAKLSFSRAIKKVGTGWSVNLQSFSKAVNCLTIQDLAAPYISAVFAEYPWDPASNTSAIDDSSTGSYVQFTSHPLGIFSDQNGSASTDSAKVYFDDNLYYESGVINSSDVEFIAPITDFTTGAGASFNFARVTGVRFHFKGAQPTENAQIKIMALRCVPLSKTTGPARWLSAEINTLEQNVSVPVNGYNEDRVQIPPMILGARLDTIASDPSPIDSRQAMIFQTGLGQAPSRLVTNATGNGTVVTYTTNTAHRLTPGQTVSISGVNPSAYNLSSVEVVSCPTNKTFTVADTTTTTYTGGGQVAVDYPPYNRIMLFARQQEFDQMHRETWLTAEYGFRMSVGDEDSFAKRYKTTRVKSQDDDHVLYWDIHPGEVFEETYDVTKTGISYLPDLNNEINYEFSASFTGNSISLQIQELSSAEQPQRVIYDAPSVSSAEWSVISGRIGWYVELADYDTYVSAVDLESAAYALLVTKVFESETPVEGAQLFTVDSGSKNLFENFFSLSNLDIVRVDNQKTYSQRGSFVFRSFGETLKPGLVSNQFTVNDWNHISIEFQFWAPKELKTETLRPKLSLRPIERLDNTEDVFAGLVPAAAPVAFDFIPGAWSYVSLDLRGINAKNGDYQLVIESDEPFRNNWWIDDVRINSQTIEWEMRAIENGSWSPFRNNVNRQYGALHLSENQIGRQIQLQARALTEDAWIAEYTLLPKYIAPGRLYNRNDYDIDPGYIVSGVDVISANDNGDRKLQSAVDSRSSLVALGAYAVYPTGPTGPVRIEDDALIGVGAVIATDYFEPRTPVVYTDTVVVLGRSRVNKQ